MEAAPPPEPAPGAGGAAPEAAAEAEALRCMPFADGIDARLLAATACMSWLANAATTGLAWAKLAGAHGSGAVTVSSWPLAFAPLWASHAMQLLLHAAALASSVRHAEVALGGEVARQAASATLAEAAQHAHAAAQLRRRHVYAHCSHVVDSISALVAKALFCAQLEAHDAAREAGASYDWSSMRLALVPLWLGWACAAGLTCAGRRRAEETVQSSTAARAALRDGRYVFFLLLACKLYGLDAYTWRALCGGAWGGAALICGGLTLRCAKAGLQESLRSPGGGALAQGALFVLGGCGPLAFATFRVAAWLDNALIIVPGDVSPICLPCLVGWTVMWCGSIIAHRGLVLRAQAAAGAHAARAQALLSGLPLPWDWRAAPGGGAPRGLAGAPTPTALLAALQAGRAQDAREWVDALSDAQVIALAAQLGAAKAAPGTLLRASARLFRFAPAGDASAMTPAPLAAHAAASPHVAIEVEAAPGEADASGAEAGRGDGDVAAGDDDDGLCFVCCDRRADCVFLPCGHGGACVACAARLWVRPPHECATCRAPVALVVQIADAASAAAAPPGTPVAVKPLQPPPHAQLAPPAPIAAAARQSEPRAVPARVQMQPVQPAQPPRASVRLAGGMARPALRPQLPPSAL